MSYPEFVHAVLQSDTQHRQLVLGGAAPPVAGRVGQERRKAEAPGITGAGVAGRGQEQGAVGLEIHNTDLEKKLLSRKI